MRKSLSKNEKTVKVTVYLTESQAVKFKKLGSGKFLRQEIQENSITKERKDK